MMLSRDVQWGPVLQGEICQAYFFLLPPLSLWFSRLLRYTGSRWDRKTNSISSYLVELPRTPTIFFFFASQNFLPPSSCVSWWSLITGENTPEWDWGFGNELQTVPTWLLNNIILALVSLWGPGDWLWFAGTFVRTPFEMSTKLNVLHPSHFHVSGHLMSNLLPPNFWSLNVNLRKFPLTTWSEQPESLEFVVISSVLVIRNVTICPCCLLLYFFFLNQEIIFWHILQNFLNRLNVSQHLSENLVG